jgi:RimJ/RimL family protein N-acetyltransferase
MSVRDPANVTLVDLEGARFYEYREHLVRDYAADKVRAGAWPADEAEERSAREVDGLLPDGPLTPDHYLYSVRDESVPAEIGNLWVSPRDSGAGRALWIYDIAVHEEYRRRGYAEIILHLVEDKARELGASRVELHVFGHNQAARALYEKLGYTPTGITMAKPVGD